MERISDRHEGDLGGRLEPFDRTRPVAVAVVVAPATAHLASTQHAAWMVVNLLARAAGVVSTVLVVCPTGVPLVGRIVPLAPRDLPLHDALVQGGCAIGAVAVQLVPSPESGDYVLVIGDGSQYDHDRNARLRFVSGHGWWGGVSDHPFATAHGQSELPFGPYVAAALAVGEIFLHARLPGSATRAVATYGWDLWTQTLTSMPAADAPTSLAGLDLSGTDLAGVGAVGSTWVHTLWATPGLRGHVRLADADQYGVTTTNLNRCTIFGAESLGRPKAFEAATIAADADITWQPHHGPAEGLEAMPTVLVSAVDTNLARQALQGRYPPRILSASTFDLRAEVLRVGPPGSHACLRCYNPPEEFIGDDELRARLHSGGPDAVHALAAQTGIAEADIREWMQRPRCGELGARLLEALREQQPEPPARFAVGFTSVMAGVMLAAETVKTYLDQPLNADFPEANNATFQFLRPAAAVNAAGLLAADPRCPACSSNNPGVGIWRRRLAGSALSGLEDQGREKGNIPAQSSAPVEGN